VQRERRRQHKQDQQKKVDLLLGHNVRRNSPFDAYFLDLLLLALTCLLELVEQWEVAALARKYVVRREYRVTVRKHCPTCRIDE
jgi:hypothetical protein